MRVFSDKPASVPTEIGRTSRLDGLSLGGVKPSARVSLNLAPVVIGPAMPLALWLAANALLESIWGWMKTSMAVRTAAGLGQCVSSEIERDSNF